SAGIPLLGTPQITDKIIRYKTNGDHNPNCWYVLRQHGELLVGSFGCWKRGITQNWSNRNGAPLSGQDRNDLDRIWREQERLRKAEEARFRDEARGKCQAQLAGCPVAQEHPYLTRKGVKPYGRLLVSNAEITKGWLALPLQDTAGVMH